MGIFSSTTRHEHWNSWTFVLKSVQGILQVTLHDELELVLQKLQAMVPHKILCLS